MTEFFGESQELFLENAGIKIGNQEQPKYEIRTLNGPGVFVLLGFSSFLHLLRQDPL